MKHLFSLLAILCPLLLAAQPQDYFKKSSKISKGTLPNGVSYYLVQNGSDKSFADFALVQKGNESRETTRNMLENLPHFPGIKPYEYLAEKGIGYTVSGLASYSHSGSVYRFQKVPVYDGAIADSLLLMVFDLMGSYPGEQAIVISGDINAAEKLERMKLFSMLVSPRRAVDISDEFKWEPWDSIEFECAHLVSDRVAYIDATFCTPRMSASDLGSAQGWLAEMFAEEVGTIVCKRLEDEFRRRDLPQGGISFSYRGSKHSLKQERYHIRICVDKENLTHATEILGAVTSSFSHQGISREEFLLAKDCFTSRKELPLPKSSSGNPAYVNKCISDYLFGAGLYEDESQREFFLKNRLEPSLERRLLTNFAVSVFNRDRNVILHYSSPENLFSRDSLISHYYNGWDSAAAGGVKAISGINVASLDVPKGKLKIKSTSPDPSIGGEIWTFENGIKVLYKKVPVKGIFSYAFMFRGGAWGISDPKPGELPYIGEILSLYDIGEMSAGDFRAVMDSKGINLEPQITSSDLRFTGTAPVSSLPMLFNGIYSLAYRRNYNSGTFDYYRRCQLLRSETDRRGEYGMAALFDSLSSPQYALSEYRNLQSLSNDTPVKAQEFYEKEFESFSDGLIVLVGDLDAYSLKSYLSEVLWAFGSNTVADRGNPVEHRLAKGRTRLSTGSGNPLAGDGTVSVNVFLANGVPYSLQRYAALSVGANALRRELIAELASLGMYVSVKEDFELRPSEIMSLTVQCRKCTGAGLPAGVGPADTEYALISVQKALEKMASVPIDPKDLKAYKASLTEQMKADGAHPETLVNAALSRYALNKNVFMGFEPAINAVSAQEIMSLMKTLQEGVHIEYTVK